MISALKLRQDPSPHLSKLFSSEYPSAATFLVDTPTDVLPKKNRRYGVDDLDARVNEIANAIQRISRFLLDIRAAEMATQALLRSRLV